MGTYEQDCRVWSPDATPWDFSMQLLPDDLDRLSRHLEIGFKHFPAIGRAGIKKVVNGPFTFAPDGNPLVGPVRGLRNYWCACGVMAGFRARRGRRSGAVAVDGGGRPGRRISSRWTSRASAHSRRRAYTNIKVQENYRRRFRIAFPERGVAGRAAAATHAGLRPAAGRGRRVRRQFRPRGCALVRAEGHGAGRDADISPLQCLPRRARRVPRGAQRRGPHGDHRDSASTRSPGPTPHAWLDRVLAGKVPRAGPHGARADAEPAGRIIGDFSLACLRRTVS